MATFKTLVDAMAAVVANTTANRASDITNIQNALKDIVSGYSTGTLANPGQLVVVAKSKGDFTSLASAVAAITDASASKPYAILVMPGIYETANVTLPDYVSLVGVDRNSCVLKSTTGSVTATLKPGTNSAIRDLTIANDVNGIQTHVIDTNGKTGIVIDNCVISMVQTTAVDGSTLLRTAAGATVNVSNTNFVQTISNDVMTIGIFVGHTSANVILRSCEYTMTLVNLISAGILITNGALQCYNCVFKHNASYFSGHHGGTSLYDGCWIEATGANEYPFDIMANNATLYNCTLKSHGTATYCIIGGSYNIKVAHCRMNRASPIHANLTNLIGTPYNVMDTDI